MMMMMMMMVVVVVVVMMMMMMVKLDLLNVLIGGRDGPGLVDHLQQGSRVWNWFEQVGK